MEMIAQFGVDQQVPILYIGTWLLAITQIDDPLTLFGSFCQNIIESDT